MAKKEKAMHNKDAKKNKESKPKKRSLQNKENKQSSFKKIKKGLDEKKRIEKIMEIITAKFKSRRKPTVRRTSAMKSPFKTLISCLLSLRTKDEFTEKASKALFKVADSPEKILGLSQERLEKLIFSTGYYKNKAKTLKSVCSELIEKHNSKVPETKEELMAIKGIGPKTANIVLCFSFGQNVIPVDTHVHRISNRLGIVSADTPEKTELELMKVLPKKYWREINTAFILFGKSVCLPISPKCSICPVAGLCPKVNVAKHR